MSSSQDLSTLAVIVVNYGSSELLAANLAPLTRLHSELRVVVVDNLSSTAERKSILSLAAAERWATCLPGENLGFGRGMNLGVKAAADAGAEHFLLLNPDARIETASVSALLTAVRAEPLALLAPRVLRPDGSVWFDGSDLYLDDGRIRSARRRIEGARVEPWLSGACLMVSRQLWDRVGGFDPSYFLYWEDVDLSWQVRRVGGELRVMRSATAIHAEGGTQSASEHRTSGLPKSAVYYYYNIRNRLLFASLRLSEPEMRRWEKQALPIAWEVLRQGGRRQLLTSLRPWSAAFRGVRDGRVFVRRAMGSR